MVPGKIRTAVRELTEPSERRAQRKGTNCEEVSGLRLVKVTPSMASYHEEVTPGISQPLGSACISLEPAHGEAWKYCLPGTEPLTAH